MLSNELRDRLAVALNEAFPRPTEPGCISSCVWVIDLDTVNSFAIAEMSYAGTNGLFKVPYSLGDRDSVSFGEPIEIERRYVRRGTTELVASRIQTGDEIAEFVAELRQNPLFGNLEGQPNSSLFVVDLTTIGKRSQHTGTKVILSDAGLDAALPTLIGKPVHITRNLDGHFEAGKRPSAIGTFMGAVVIKGDDGRIVRAVGVLWENDFADDVQRIQAAKSTLGASYEIMYPPAAAKRVDANTIEISQYVFSGGAILMKNSAAHPETQLHVANKSEKQTPAAAALTTEQGRKQEASAMTKFAGIPDEHAAAVEALVAKAVADALTQLKAESENAKKMSDMQEKCEKSDADKAAAVAAKEQADAALAATKTEIESLKAGAIEHSNQLTEAQASLQAMTAERDAEKVKLAEIEAKKTEAEVDRKVDEKWTAIAQRHGLAGLGDEDVKARKAILRKVVAKTEVVDFDEMEKVYAGGRGAMQVPLPGGVATAVANGADKAAEEWFPAAKQRRIR